MRTLLVAVSVSLFARAAIAEFLTLPPQQTATHPVVVLSRIAIYYPAIAESARVRGTVNVRVGVRPDGSVSEATLLDGVPLLNDAAVKAASAAAFECRQCTELVTTHTIAFVFSFPDAFGNAPPATWKQTGNASSEVTIYGANHICDHCSGIPSPVRSARCLWLWRCGTIYTYP